MGSLTGLVKNEMSAKELAARKQEEADKQEKQRAVAALNRLAQKDIVQLRRLFKDDTISLSSRSEESIKAGRKKFIKWITFEVDGIELSLYRSKYMEFLIGLPGLATTEYSSGALGPPVGYQQFSACEHTLAELDTDSNFDLAKIETIDLQAIAQEIADVRPD